MDATLISFRACVTYFTALLVGLLYSLVVPTLSVLLGHEMGVRPFLIGTFFITIALTAIVFSQSIALWSEKFPDRRMLVFAGLLCGAIACLGFAYLRVYSFILLCGLTFFSLSFVSSSQNLAQAREYADQNLPVKQARLFNAILRAGVALAWVVGPPLGFTLLAALGSKSYYLSVALLYIFVALVAVIGLPKVEKTEVVENAIGEKSTLKLLMAITAFSFLYATNHSYLIALPLYITNNLHENVQYAGWLMGTAAALEIPIMIFVGWLALRMEMLPLIRVGAFAGIIFYSGVWLASDLWQLFVLQLFNAIFIGCVSGLGMTWFQDMLPGKAGSSSALYLNCTSAGSIGGGLIIAIFADFYGFRQIFAINAMVAGLALVLLIYFQGRRHFFNKFAEE